MQELLDFHWYAPRVIRIQSKNSGLVPLNLRKIQSKFIHHIENDFPDGIVRSISLKPRQAGWSTIVSAYNSHRTWNWFDEKGIVLADKAGRTGEIFSIYKTIKTNADPFLLPSKHVDDVFYNREMYFGSRRSGFKAETAQDPNAGRSGTRRWAHLSEYAFYPYAESVDEGVLNSVPLAPGTRIFKESTAFGMTGHGESFFLQWEAAERGDHIFKPFFCAWYEVDDYALAVPRGFILTKQETDLVKRCPDITNANLVWRRMKLKEYATSKESLFTPEERFCQDFPSYPEEAFLNSGRPVFDQERLKRDIHSLNTNPAKRDKVVFKKQWLSMFASYITVYKAPRKGERYSVGADVSEGLEGGDASTFHVINEKGEEVACFYGHLDPDQFGHVLVDIAEAYNKALITPEINNMGHTTLQAIKNRDYRHVYMRSVYDEDHRKETLKMGWRTTSSNKQMMLYKLIAAYRDRATGIKTVETLKEMKSLSRESDGNVTLNGKDRTVAACLAHVGLDQLYAPAIVINPSKPEKLHLESKDISRKKITRPNTDF